MSGAQEPPWRRWALWGGGGAAVLAAVVVVLLLYREPIAEKVVQDKLAALGLGGSELAISRLTPWSVEVQNLSTGPAGSVRISRLTAELSWTSLSSPAVGAIALEGVQLSVSLSEDGSPDWGDLAPLFSADGGAGPSASIPSMSIRDCLIDVAHTGGPTVVSLTKASVVPGDGGGISIEDAVIDIVHPMGELSLQLSGRRAVQGALDLRLTVDGGQGAWQGVSLADLEGTLHLAGDPGNLAGLTGEVDLNAFGVVLPQGILADGSLTGTVSGGVAKLAAKLSDEALALTLSANGEMRVDDLSAPVTATLETQAGEIGRLPFGDGLRGRARVHLSTEAPLADLLAASLSETPAFDATLTAEGVEAEGVPGAWGLGARAKVRVDGGVLTASVDPPVSLSGEVLGGKAEVAVPGMVAFRLSPFGLTALRPGPARLTLDQVGAGDVRLDGPVTFLLTAGKDGIVLSEKDGIAAIKKADLSLTAETPSLGVTVAGNNAIVRTAKLKGKVSATFPETGAPGVKVSLGGLAAHIPGMDVEADGLRLYARTRGGPDESWNMSAKAATLRHTAASPFAAETRGHWNRKRWSAEGTFRQKDTGLILSFTAKADNRSGKGSARVDTVPLNLASVPGGVHGITPLLAPFVKSLTGIVQVSASTAWDASGIKPIDVSGTLRGAGFTPAASVLPPEFQGAFAGISAISVTASLPPQKPADGLASIALTGGNVKMGAAQATGVSARVDLERIWPPLSRPAQEIRIAQIVAALPVADGRLRFQIKGPSTATVEKAELTTIGGQIWVEDVEIKDGKLPAEVIFNVDGLGLADLATQVNVLGLKADGLLSGKVPVLISEDGKATVQGGLLKSQGKGLVSFIPPTRAADQAGAAGRMDMVLDILEDLRFENMTVNLDGDARKDVNIRLRLEGRNPKIQEGRPVDLTVNLSGNLGEAIQAEFQNFDIKGLAGASAGGN